MSRPAPPPPISSRLPEYGRAFARVRDNPRAASVFAPDATVRPVVLGPGLLAEARTSVDDEIHVLCVQNLTDEPLAFVPITHLPPARDRDAPVMFICGETETTATDDGDLVCQIPPRAFVWLGCFPQRAAASARPSLAGSPSARRRTHIRTSIDGTRSYQT